MAQAAEREGQRELCAIRRGFAREGSPCSRCKRVECPELCWPRIDWNRRHASDQVAVDDRRYGQERQVPETVRRVRTRVWTPEDD